MQAARLFILSAGAPALLSLATALSSFAVPPASSPTPLALFGELSQPLPGPQAKASPSSLVVPMCEASGAMNVDHVDPNGLSSVCADGEEWVEPDPGNRRDDEVAPDVMGRDTALIAVEVQGGIVDLVENPSSDQSELAMRQIVLGYQMLHSSLPFLESVGISRSSKFSKFLEYGAAREKEVRDRKEKERVQGRKRQALGRFWARCC
ncbi:hypothetical protein BDK51DRAFT_33652 [Blyttiomyces helicus]|uniref:Uncharacterized protein n=1 Tax=Blyttiomyces helicus TaxID=388810 RepID=A0A4P9WD42_9FUNG|nr:hypothetical protein BDK51DRAFT_33652 [Blyttiomyces helicus]|eukprot:RKO88850.1 hypothetical protein BDK51DRAFT_33652 [Blyttiomyces helicus]